MSSGNRRRQAAGFAGFIADQVAGLRERAATLARYGAREAGASLEQAAVDLEAAFRRWWLEELSVSAAAVETGYSAERLRELVREGRVPSALEPGKPIRLRRCDLPRKVGAEQSATLDAVASRLGIE